MSTRAATFSVLAVLCLLLAPSAGAKEGIVALLTRPLTTAPSGGVHAEFALENVETGQRFSALGVFVRVMTRDGRRLEVGAEERGLGSGNYTAWIRARRDQIIDIEIGLAGTSSGPSGTQRSDAMFLIANDPHPGRAVVPSAASASNPDSALDSRILAVIALVLTLGALAIGGAVLIFRRSEFPFFRRRATARP